jgi:hypothetical protein
MSAEQSLHDWLISYGFTHRKSDNSYTKAISGTFSVEIDKHLSLVVLCNAEASLTGVEYFEVDFDTLTYLLVLERGLSNLRKHMKVTALENNVNALLKMTSK